MISHYRYTEIFLFAFYISHYLGIQKTNNHKANKLWQQRC